MTERNAKILLRVVLVAMAVMLGAAINLIQTRGPSLELFPRQTPSGQPAGTQDASNQAPAFEQEKAASTPEQSASVQENKPAAAETAQASSSEAAPEPQAPASTGQASAQAPQASAPQETPPAAAPDKSSGAEPERIEIARGDHSISQPSVSHEEEKIRAAHLGRQVPLAANEQQDAPERADTGVAGLPAGQSTAEPQPGVNPETAAPAPEAQSGPVAQASPAIEKQQEHLGEAQQGKARSGGEKAAKPGEEAHARPGAEQSGASGQGDAGQAAKAEKTASVKGGKVLGVKLQEAPREIRLTITTDAPAERVTTFYAKDPSRLAVDIAGVWQLAGPSVIAVNSELFERMRLGTHPDKLRLVVDFKDKKYAWQSQAVIEKNPDSVVIRIPVAPSGGKEE